MNNKKYKTKKIKLGSFEIGGDADVSVQSMCCTKTWDVEATVAQIRAMRAAGCDIVRIAIPDMRAARAVSEIKEQVDMPLVADIHFDYRLALEAAARGIDKIRINPGNIGGEENVKAVAEACRKRNIPIRIGVNGGSLEPRLIEKYGHPCPEAMIESARSHVELLNKYDFDDICLSMKSSSVPLTIEAYRMAAECFNYPLHLGVTETGTEWDGTIKSAVGIGTLLSEGIGDTIRVSLTADPVHEVTTGIAILKALDLRKGGVRFVSCPTCGRTEIDLISLANQVAERLRNVDRDITVAVMGCVVNGPGEAREADYGIAGGKDKGLIFKKGKVLGTYPYDRLCDALLELIEKDGENR
ncbi:MAG: flavodoxin-dependent (E)-4-hydroxy-3-methylbut-2-enyl-diphosphate synthase [Candidatus Limivicinus sp.]|jgi:(E)-4-hydroxy-3-methylbut-2-enyl-diphosphate synthase